MMLVRPTINTYRRPGIVTGINRQHPLARGLISAYAPSSLLVPDVAGSVNGVGGTLTPFSGSTAVMGANQDGPALICNAATSDGVIGPNLVTGNYFADDNAVAFSIFVRMKVLGYGAANQGIASIVWSQPNISPYIVAGILAGSNALGPPGTGTGVQLFTNNALGSLQRLDEGLGYNIGVMSSALVTYQAVNAAGSMAVYRNGILSNSGNAGSSNPIHHTSTSAMGLGNFTGGGPSNVAINVVYMWSRQLSAGEAMQLAADPYGLLRGSVERIALISTPAGVVPTTVFRKTLSGLGGRVGSRQIQGRIMRDAEIRPAIHS
jgi:hypothetical protein